MSGIARIHPAFVAAPLAWLERHGAPIPDVISNVDLRAADGVPIPAQRVLLETVAAIGGDGALIELAERLVTHVDHPLVFSLLNSVDVDEAIDKEQRLMRYFHASHTIRVLARDERSIELEHYSKQGRQPVRPESLTVLGNNLVLVRELGYQDLRATLPSSEHPDRVVFAENAPRSPFPEGGHSHWRLTWSGFVPVRAPMPGLDELLTQRSDLTDLTRVLGVAGDVAALVSTDLTRRWTLDGVAQTLGHSKRSLQRRLAGESTSFSAVVDGARIEKARKLLADPRLSVTEIGYLCGFSDSAHFSRRFRAAEGRSPSAFRGE